MYAFVLGGKRHMLFRRSRGRQAFCRGPAPIEGTIESETKEPNSRAWVGTVQRLSATRLDMCRLEGV
jgi:hypothetical protein